MTLPAFHKEKIIFVLAVSGVLGGCGPAPFSSAQNPITAKDLEASTSGLQVSIKNSLPEESIEEKRFRPHLNAYLCAPHQTKENEPAPRTEDRCIALIGMIRNGTTESFLVPKEKLVEIYSKGKGKARFEFMDDHQVSSTTWSCWGNSVKLDSNFEVKQVWNVEVTQRHALSYGCLVDRVKR